MGNEANDPLRSFRISKEAIGSVIAFQKTWDDKVMVWHTHPGGTEGPSDWDIDTMDQHTRYLVVTLPSGSYACYGAPSLL